jgi:hypothetical protein
VIAHLGGVPVEEMLPAVVCAGSAVLLAGARLWTQLWRRRRSEEADAYLE